MADGQQEPLCQPALEMGQARPWGRNSWGLPTTPSRPSLALGSPHHLNTTLPWPWPPQPTSLSFDLNSVTKGHSPLPNVSLNITRLMKSACHPKPTPALTAHIFSDGQFIVERLVSSLQAHLLRCEDWESSPCCWPGIDPLSALRGAQHTRQLLCCPVLPRAC